MKRRVIVTAATIVLLGGLVWLVFSMVPREPVYQGRHLSAWVGGLFPNTNQMEFAVATNALDEVGAKAIPTLLRMLRAHDSPLKLKLLALADKQHFVKVSHVDPGMQNFSAEHGFLILGPQRAVSAVPDLIKIYDEKLSLYSQSCAGYILGSIGPPAKAAIPSLLRETRNTNDSLRCNAIQALEQIHQNPDAVVPALIVGLQDTDTMVRYWSAVGLGEFGPNAKSAVPALINLLRTEKTKPRNDMYSVSSVEGTESTAFRSLQRIDPDAAAKVLQEYKDTDPTGAVTRVLEDFQANPW